MLTYLSSFTFLLSLQSHELLVNLWNFPFIFLIARFWYLLFLYKWSGKAPWWFLHLLDFGCIFSFWNTWNTFVMTAFNCIFFFLLHLLLCNICVSVSQLMLAAPVYHRAHVEVRGQFAGVGFFLLPLWFQNWTQVLRFIGKRFEPLPALLYNFENSNYIYF